jgi:DNA-binding winged helix-turn-helix (wHTH) protein
MSRNCVLFTLVMTKKLIYSFATLVSILILSCSSFNNDEFAERAKIALREVGNQLLLTNQDSTSLILPVVVLDESKYRLSFQQQLSFEPGNLVSIVQSNFKKSTLPEYYRVEVIQCKDGEVAYSYEMSMEEENTIIPCADRVLPKSCYIIELRFTKNVVSVTSNQSIIFAILCCIFSVLAFVLYKRRKTETIEKRDKSYTKIGSYKFYADQNKLIKEAVEISLSKKECELLEIFVANPNQVIKRDVLTKRVWEDHGVFVGRSLDTYISKLRKKLIHDDTIKLTNIHGVGYKLEVNKSS